MAIPLEDLKGVLRLTVKRGINLAVRDITTSDPYVTVSLGHQNLRTRAILRTLNPEWNEDLTLYATNPNEALKLNVYDKDAFFDDKIGDTEVDMKPFLESVENKVESKEDGTIICKVKPCRENCLIEKSTVMWMNGKVTQTMFLRLRNVESGEIELQMQWIDVPPQ